MMQGMHTKENKFPLLYVKKLLIFFVVLKICEVTWYINYIADIIIYLLIIFFSPRTKSHKIYIYIQNFTLDSRYTH